jgi:predicted pyridoxine 5'-phosphate oxidase superfamily flavin-nucleotide-binding protein
MSDLRSPADVFHAGERAVQERAGVRATAAKLGPRMVQPELSADFAHFLAAANFLYVAAPTRDGRVWVSPLVGPAGFAHAVSPTQIVIGAGVADDDPLAAILADGPTQAGVLVLEPMSRSRIRLNGTLSVEDDHLSLALREAFGNCPKYIQRRRPVAAARSADADAPTWVGTELHTSQREMVDAADTFIIGSRHPERGADASHRGGRPGFVVVAADGRSLTFPDYAGNTMFQTLGNLSVDPAVGLLFVDWESGRTLQLSGRASTDWDPAHIAAWPGAERLVDVRIENVIDRPAGLPLVWELVEAHRLNPPAPERP